MSAHDYAGMQSVVTEDFQLLEAGEVWDIDVLIEAIRPGKNSYERRNSFSLIKIVSRNEFVWASYWNKATFKMPDESNEIVWLESVVLVQVEDEWKLLLMHSTRVPLENIPPNIVFEEYVD